MNIIPGWWFKPVRSPPEDYPFDLILEIFFRIQDGRKKANEFTKAHRDIGQDYGSIGFLSRKAITIEAAR